jgi:hypothetical protein
MIFLNRSFITINATRTEKGSAEAADNGGWALGHTFATRRVAVCDFVCSPFFSDGNNAIEKQKQKEIIQMKTYENRSGNHRIAFTRRCLHKVEGEAPSSLPAQVVQVGPLFALANVVGRPTLGKVRVDHDLIEGPEPLQVGDLLILGAIEYLSAGPRAMRACRQRHVTRDLPNRSKGQPSHRCRGSITRVSEAGNFGQITESITGRRFFVHTSQFSCGSPLRLNSTVSFTPAETPRGLVALEVRSISE